MGRAGAQRREATASSGHGTLAANRSAAADREKDDIRMLQLLGSIPPLVIYVAVGLVVGVESVGVPLPGEIVLISASVGASTGLADPLALGAVAAGGAIIGDSVGYAIGKRYGTSLLDWLGRKAPKHFGPKRLARAERAFDRWGAWAVLFGRFVALLRILAGPLSGVLGMPYGKFLAANATGGLLWAGTITSVAYVFGLVAEKWFRQVSWVALAAVVVLAAGGWIYLRRRRANRAKEAEPEKVDA